MAREEFSYTLTNLETIPGNFKFLTLSPFEQTCKLISISAS